MKYEEKLVKKFKWGGMDHTLSRSFHAMSHFIAQ